MAINVSVSRFIKSAAFAFCVLGSTTSAVQARDLLPEEQSVCASLKVCLDIVRRHDASEFDYDTLEIEFRRFGPAGKTALFSLLESNTKHADVALLISSLGPLTQQDRQRVKQKWSQEKARSYLPLLLDGHPTSRDFLLQSLAYPNAEIRETARLALTRLPQSANTAPLPKSAQRTLLLALKSDPIAEAAPFLARLNPAGNEAQIAELLRSGNTGVVIAAYSALYRKSPAEAFNMMLAEMDRIDRPAQARAIGNMLAVRHRSRPDGFYLKFARDMSGDPKLSATARASGLHAVLTITEGPFPTLTSERAEALSFLVSAQPFVAQDHYLPYLKKVRAEAAMDLIWGVANTEKWINRDRILTFYNGHKSSAKVIGDLLQSNDVRSFQAGLQGAKPMHERFIRAQIDNPVTAIGSAARQKLRLKKSRNSNQTCAIKPFDLADKRNQMPFFDSGWMVSDNNARVSLPRSYLTTAHPTHSGWLAGYDLTKPNTRSVLSGGSLLHYDNKSGAFKDIGHFSGPVAVLPSRPLKLGQTTDRFWVVDHWGGEAFDVSAYMLDLTDGTSRIMHIGALPKTAKGFSVTSNGDLLISFSDKGQTPIRLSQTGDMSLACSTPQSASAFR